MCMCTCGKSVQMTFICLVCENTGSALMATQDPAPHTPIVSAVIVLNNPVCLFLQKTDMFSMDKKLTP